MGIIIDNHWKYGHTTRILRLIEPRKDSLLVSHTDLSDKKNRQKPRLYLSGTDGELARLEQHG